MRKRLVNNAIVYLFMHMWKYSEGNRKRVIVFWVMFATAGTIPVAISPWLMARVMNIVQLEGATPANLGTIILLLFLHMLCGPVFWSLHGPGRVLELMNAFRLRVMYREGFFDGIMHMPMHWQVENHSGKTTDVLEKGTGALYSFSEKTFEILYTILSLILCYSVLIYFSPVAGGIAIAFLAISASLTMKMDEKLIKNYTALAKAESEAAKGIADALRNVATVIVLRVEKYVLESIMKRVKDQRQLATETYKLQELKWFSASMCCALMTFTVLSHYFWMQSRSNAPALIGNAFLLIAYLGRIDNIFFKFTGLYGDIVKWKVRVRVAEDLAKDFKKRDFSKDLLPANWCSIRINDLSFGYDPSVPRLKGINLGLRRGRHVALIGTSGCGKTTFLTIMRSLYEANKGSVLVDGKVCPGGFSDFAEDVALVQQDPQIFDASAGYNITMGVEYSEDEIAWAIETARFTNVLARLPHGLDTHVKQDGVNLSGGENQRMALARGILASRRKQVVLLDEATSNIDAINARAFYAKILADFRDKLVISTVHGMDLLPLFDHIVVFEQGEVVGDGTLLELLKTCPQFQRLWSTHRPE